MMLVIPQEISPEKLGMKYILKDKFVDYQSCQKYVEENLYFRKDKNVGVFYKIDQYFNFIFPIKYCAISGTP